MLIQNKTRSIYLLFVIFCVLINKKSAESADCADKFVWKCDSGDQCIDDADRCDGIKNCDDGSDETADNCLERRSTCNPNNFVCAYGACIPIQYKCNGKENCADGSDEVESVCEDEAKWQRTLQGNCPELEVQCTPGECINSLDICDGKTDCRDGFDESLKVCAGHYCHPKAFRCAYGGCVNGIDVCNGIKDCVDGSDEAARLCNHTTPTVNPSTFLITPQKTTTTVSREPVTWRPISPSSSSCETIRSDNMIITNELNNQIIRPGEFVPKSTQIIFACQRGHDLIGSIRTTCGRNGKWSPEWPQCIHRCSDKHPRSGFSTKATFEYNGTDVSSENKFREGTIAKIFCAFEFEKPRNFVSELKCVSTGWDRVKQPCNMICGQPTDNITPFVKDGDNTNITEVPWHVGIYKKSKDGFKNICGGTLISPRIVVTAAHCFFDNSKPIKISRLQLSDFQVAAGKYFSTYNSQNEPTSAFVEKRGIKKIWIDPDFKGQTNNFYRDLAILTLESFIEFFNTIKPICLTFPDEAQRSIPDGLDGKLAGWSQLNSTILEPMLQTLQMSSLSYDTCKAKLWSDLKLDLSGDKFCLASFGDGKTCRGDSGGGFIRETGRKVFSLYGIISYSPTRTQDCSRDQVVVATNVLYYKNIIETMIYEDTTDDVDYTSFLN